MKVFVDQTDHEWPEGGGWRTMARAAEQEQGRIEERIREDEEMEADRERYGAEEEDKEWWQEFVNYPDERSDERDPAYWNGRNVDLTRNPRL